MSAREALKAATAEAHERLDGRFAAYDLADRDDYAAFLTAHARAFLPIEQALSDAGADSLVDGWSDARRSDALRHDLSAMGLIVPDPLPAPSYPDEADLIGGLYVLEGSRLGGAVLRQQVGSFPHAFLDAVHAPGRWREFIALMERKLYASGALEAASAAAGATFAVFEAAAVGSDSWTV